MMRAPLLPGRQNQPEPAAMVPSIAELGQRRAVAQQGAATLIHTTSSGRLATYIEFATIAFGHGFDGVADQVDQHPAWGWGFRSAARSWKLTADGSGGEQAGGRGGVRLYPAGRGRRGRTWLRRSGCT